MTFVLLIRFLKIKNLYFQFKNYHKEYIERFGILTKYNINYIKIIQLFNFLNWKGCIDDYRTDSYKIEDLLFDFEELLILKKFNKTKQEIFDEFLTTHKVYETFYQNATMDGYDDIITPGQFLKTFILQAFKWYDTKEGYEFWKTLDETWCKYIDDIYTH